MEDVFFNLMRAFDNIHIVHNLCSMSKGGLSTIEKEEKIWPDRQTQIQKMPEKGR